MCLELFLVWGVFVGKHALYEWKEQNTKLVKDVVLEPNHEEVARKMLNLSPSLPTKGKMWLGGIQKL